MLLKFSLKFGYKNNKTLTSSATGNPGFYEAEKSHLLDNPPT